MVRRIRIQREQLIEGGYQLIIEQGFSKFNARNIAKQINCSTQPIYREFTNMTNFKAVMVKRVIAKYQDFLEDQQPETLDQLMHLIVNYATDYPEEYHRFFLEDVETIKQAKAITQKVFNALKQPPAETLYDAFWPYCLGKALLAIMTPEDATGEFLQLA